MYFKSLQSFRGLFALLIFLNHYHYSDTLDSLFPAGGDAGVAFFFILSGFVMSVGYMDQTSQIGYDRNFPAFIWKRMSKLYPLHLLCLLLSVKIFCSTDFWPNIANLLLIQAWIPYPHWFFSGNGVSWCLSAFLFIYITVPLIFKLYRTHRRYFILSYLAVTLFYALAIIPVIPQDFENAIIYICPATRLLDFILGIILWDCYRHLRPVHYNGYISAICGLCVLGLFVATLLVYFSMPSPYSLSLLWWPSVCAIILYAATMAPKFLNSRPLVKFGDISFSFYLIHVLVIYATYMALNKFGIQISPFPRLILALGIATLSAMILHRWYVIPVERYIRSRIKARNSDTGAS